MVDTPKETNGDKATEDNPSGKKAKHGHHRCRSKPRHNNTGTGEENPEGAEEEYSLNQPTFKQTGPATVGYLERDNYTPSPEDEVSLGNDEFSVPKDQVEQVCFKRRLTATARSLKGSKSSLKSTRIC